MKKIFVALAVASVAFTFACAPKQSATKARPGHSSATLQAANRAEAKKIAKNWNVTCASSANSSCPDYVAQMAVRLPKNQIQVCTATLIASDTMLINSHCLKADDPSLQPADICKSAKFFFSDKSASGAESVMCKDVISNSTILPNLFTSPDWALVHIDHALKRAPVVISRAGLTQNELLTIYKVDPDMTNGGGTITTDQCKILQGTAYMPDSKNDLSSVLVTRDCQIIDGNSGSPLIDKGGAVAAIAFASVDDNSSKLKFDLASGNAIDAAAEEAKMGAVTNLACLNIPGAPAVPTACATTPAIGQASVAPNFDPQANLVTLKKAASEAALAHKDLMDPKLHYATTLSDDKKEMTVAATCFFNVPSWISQYVQGDTHVDSAQIKTPIMQWTINWTLDDNLQIQPKLVDASPPDVRDITFDPATLQAKGESLIQGLPGTEAVTWKACPVKSAN